MNNFLKAKHHNISNSFLAGIFLFLITITTFLPAVNHKFVNYDDQMYITENTMVIKGLTHEGILWAFSNIDAGSWYPLTWLSHMLDCQIYGLNPGGHHFTSILIHSINALLLFILLMKMTGASMPSFLVAAIFALHPLHVEPVAWASSRKDVLSTFFWILTMLSYTYYVRYGGIRRYLLVLLCFLLGLMSKPMLITLPFVLLLMDYWPLSRLTAGESNYGELTHTYLESPIVFKRSIISKLIVEKIPLFIMSFIVSVITFIAQKDYDAIAPLNAVPISSRISNIIVSYACYIYKSILPIKLSVHYPFYLQLPLWQVVISIFVLLVISYISLRFYRTHPYLIVGWLWFIGTLVPVIGFIQIGSQAIADRYSYVSQTGLSIMFSWAIFNLLETMHIKKIFPILIIFFISILDILTMNQLKYWQNGISLFQHAVNLDNNNLRAHNNLGCALANSGRPKDAIYHFNYALKDDRFKNEAHYNLGNAYRALGMYEKAIFHYKAALSIDPDYFKAALNLGAVYYHLHKYNEAIKYYQDVLRIDADNAGAHNNIGAIMAQQNNIEGAIYHFNMALKIDPHNKKAFKNLNKIKKENRFEQ